MQHAEAVARAGASPVLVDIRGEQAQAEAEKQSARWKVPSVGLAADVTRSADVAAVRDAVIGRLGRIDILINNAAIDAKAVEGGGLEGSRLETFSLERWNAEIAVGLTGAFLCSQILGSEMARRRRGVIVNVASDLGGHRSGPKDLSACLSRRRRAAGQPGFLSSHQGGPAGLTRYLATYWADQGVRVNAVSPGGVRTDQPEDFVARLANLIPLGRMAEAGEYQGAMLFLCSDASSYMTGANLIVDGGRTCW